MARNQAQNVESVTHGGVTLKVYEVDRRHRKIFSVAHKENGRRQLKQFSDQGAALTWALNRAKEIGGSKAPSLMLPPDDAAIYQRAKKILAGTGKALDEIAREYVDARDTLGGAVRLTMPPPTTLNAACGSFKRQCRKSLTNCSKLERTNLTGM